MSEESGRRTDYAPEPRRTLPHDRHPRSTSKTPPGLVSGLEGWLLPVAAPSRDVAQWPVAATVPFLPLRGQRRNLTGFPIIRPAGQAGRHHKQSKMSTLQTRWKEKYRRELFRRRLRRSQLRVSLFTDDRRLSSQSNSASDERSRIGVHTHESIGNLAQGSDTASGQAISDAYAIGDLFYPRQCDVEGIA